MIHLLTLAALAADLPSGAATAQHAVEAAVAVAPDRSGPPEVARSARLDLPEPEIHALGPGVEAWYVPVDGVRRAEVYVVVQRGHHELTGGPTELGQAVGALMDVATAKYPADTLSEVRDLHEIELYSWISHHNGGVALSVPLEDLGVGVALMGEVLRSPAYPKKDIARHLRDRRVFHTISGPSSPARVANAALAYAWYPADHPYGARPDLDAMKKLSGKALAEAHERWITESPITVVVVADAPWSELEPTLKPVLADLGAAGEPAAPLDAPDPGGMRVVAVDMPGQAQATLKLRLAAPAQAHEDRVAFGVLNYAFGGHFLSRLNANLREDKGFTYGGGARYTPGRHDGTVTVSYDVGAENAAAAITEIEHEIGRLVADGITGEEVEWAIRADVFDWNEVRKTAGTARGFYAQRLFDLETVADGRARGEAAEAVTPEQVQQVAARWLGPDAARLWVVVGDRSTLAPQLEGLGWTVEWIDPASAVIGGF